MFHSEIKDFLIILFFYELDLFWLIFDNLDLDPDPESLNVSNLTNC